MISYLITCCLLLTLCYSIPVHEKENEPPLARSYHKEMTIYYTNLLHERCETPDFKITSDEEVYMLADECQGYKDLIKSHEHILEILDKEPFFEEKDRIKHAIEYHKHGFQQAEETLLHINQRPKDSVTAALKGLQLQIMKHHERLVFILTILFII